MLTNQSAAITRNSHLRLCPQLARPLNRLLHRGHLWLMLDFNNPSLMNLQANLRAIFTFNVYIYLTTVGIK